MKRYLLILGLAAGCSAPQYTVMNATPTASTSTGGATTWPDVGAVETPAPKSNDVAVIVAIEDYAFLPSVPGAVENANAWENYLRKARGFKDVFVLTDQQAPIEEIERFAEQAVAAASSDGDLWFVFIGHGAALKDGSDGALIGMDAQQTIESIGARSLGRQELVAMLEKGQQQKTVLVLDTCFSGRDAGGNLLAEGTQPVIPVSAAPQMATGTVILSAAGNDEVAGQLPGAERPAFSYLLLGALRGWADDGDGAVTAKEAVVWTRQQLRHVKGRQQTPGIDGAGDLLLAARAPEDDPGVAALMKGGGTNTAAAPTSPSNAAGGTVINTNKGLIFTKPGEWGVGPAGFGVVLSLANQYSGNHIFVQKAKVAQAHAAAAMGTPMTTDGDELEVVRPVAKATYGAVTGQEVEYRLRRAKMDHSDEPWPAEHHIKFSTYQNGAAWSFVLDIKDGSARDADLAAFRKFLETVRFEP